MMCVSGGSFSYRGCEGERKRLLEVLDWRYVALEEQDPTRVQHPSVKKATSKVATFVDGSSRTPIYSHPRDKAISFGFIGKWLLAESEWDRSRMGGKVGLGAKLKRKKSGEHFMHGSTHSPHVRQVTGLRR